MAIFLFLCKIYRNKLRSPFSHSVLKTRIQSIDNWTIGNPLITTINGSRISIIKQGGCLMSCVQFYDVFAHGC